MRICSTCGVYRARKGQRNCKGCHRTAMGRYRAAARAELKLLAARREYFCAVEKEFKKGVTAGKYRLLQWFKPTYRDMESTLLNGLCRSKASMWSPKKLLYIMERDLRSRYKVVSKSAISASHAASH